MKDSNSKIESKENYHHSVRIILLNNKKLLLMHAQDPSTTRLDGKYNGDFWFLIGGEQEKGESIAQTAVREIFEETSLKENEIELGPVVWKGEFDLILSGKKRKMKQQFIVVKTSKKSVELTNLTKNEKKVIKNIKWFSLQDIKNSSEIIYPVLLTKYLPAIIDENYPDSPIEIDLGKNP